MPAVEIYTKAACQFCHRAKRLLDARGVPYIEHEISGNPGLRAEMIQRSDGRRTVPQIFIGGRGIGGSDQLALLERSGALDALLREAV